MTLKPISRTQARRLSACYRHPAEPVTGFCASCLRERLAGLDPCGPPQTSSSSSSTTAFSTSLKHPGGVGASFTDGLSKPAVPSSSSLELHRSRSFSAGKCESSSGMAEPRRMSCDVKVRNTLADLFQLDDGKGGSSKELQVESKNFGFSGVARTVFDLREEDRNGEEIRVLEDVMAPNMSLDRDVEEELKTMREHIDLEWQSRKHTTRDLRDIAGSFWAAGSLFSKKLLKWTQGQKIKKQERGSGGGDILAMRVENPNHNRSWGQLIEREIESEIADYGFGGRSCATEPRFSVDAGRMSSVDGSRFSFDEPRASWDGYLIARTIPRLTPMLSVVENVMMLAPSTANRSDNHHRISIDEQMRSINEDDTTSGGSTQPKDDYYSDSSSSQRQSSFDRSSSVKSSSKKTALGLEVDEGKSISNAKVSPATVDIFQGTKLVITERELKDWHLNSLKGDHSENFECVSKDETLVTTGGNLDGFKKSSRWRKGCNVWGFRHRSSDSKCENVMGNAIDCAVAEACQKQSREVDGVVTGASGGKLVRSTSCVASRNSSNVTGSYHSLGSVAEARGCTKKSTEDCVLERNRSASYSPSNFDNGLLRFYLTPLRSYRSKSGKSRSPNSHSIAGDVLQLN